MSEIVILRADPSHLDLIAPLFDAYRQFYKHRSDVEGARAFIAERLAKGESVIFLALNGESPLGFTQLYPSFSSTSMKRLWILNDLFVALEGRGQGVGALLLERARQFAIDTGAKGLMLETAVDNYAAQHLYERLGWQREQDFYTYFLKV